MELRGIPVSPGIKIGRAFLYRDYEHIPVHKISLGDGEAEKEVGKFKEAVKRTIEELKLNSQKFADNLGQEQADILKSQLVFMEDKFLIEKTVERIRSELLCAPYVFMKVIDEAVNVLKNVDNSYLRSRAEDIRHVGKAIMNNLIGKEAISLSDLKEEAVIVAHELSPSDTATMDKSKVLAFITDMGAKTSHTAIMARSLEIPAVLGIQNATEMINEGDMLIVDGISGVVIVNPGKDVAEEYERKELLYSKTEEQLLDLRGLKAQTIDGRAVSLMANIELPDEIDSVISHGAEGIGLFRTEYLYLNRRNLPDEEEQYRHYAEAVSKLNPERVIIRTVDLGGDKFFSNIDIAEDLSPFMGCRGIRFCLEQPDIFRVQLRAILRASAHGRAGIMFPLVSCLEELTAAKKHIEKAREELRREGAEFDEKIEVGVMIETPSAAVIADILAPEVDFFSIGTNDLIQYAMAIDRVNEKVAHLYNPSHPGILRMIKNVVDAGHSKGIKVDMCGEMAGEINLIVLLVGMGIDGLSMSPVAIPPAKKMVRAITHDFAKQAADRALRMSSSEAVLAELEGICGEYFKGIEDSSAT